MSFQVDLNKLLQEGRLMAALDLCKQTIRESPSRIEARAALYELSAFRGEWDRCENQVETIISLGGDPLHWLTHMAAIHASKARSLCWQGRERPKVVGGCEPEEESMMDDLWQAAVKAAAGDLSLTERNALDHGGMVFGPCKVNGGGVGGISTIDSRLPGVLEIAEGGDYAWLWLGAVSRIEMQGGAKNLTEVMWIPARVFLTDGGVRSASIFGLYPGTELSEDPMAVLGKATEWDESLETLSLGRGGQLFDIDDQPVPFQQIRLIEFETAGETASPAPGSPE